METEVLKLVIDAVSDIGELGVWGLVAYLATTLLLALIKFGSVILVMYWIIQGVSRTVARCNSTFDDDFLKRVRDHYRLGPHGVLTSDERDRVEDKIKSIVREDMEKTS